MSETTHCATRSEASRLKRLTGRGIPSQLHCANGRRSRPAAASPVFSLSRDHPGQGTNHELMHSQGLHVPVFPGQLTIASLSSSQVACCEYEGHGAAESEDKRRRYKVRCLFMQKRGRIFHTAALYC